MLLDKNDTEPNNIPHQVNICPEIMVKTNYMLIYVFSIDSGTTTNLPVFKRTVHG